MGAWGDCDCWIDGVIRPATTLWLWRPPTRFPTHVATARHPRSIQRYRAVGSRRRYAHSAMNGQRYSLPSERPVIGTAEAKLFRTGLPLLVVLSLPPVVGYVWRGIVYGDWGWGILGLIICAGFTWAVWHGLLARTTECHSSIYHRHARPVRYWLTITVWFVAYVMSVAVFFFAHGPASGTIHR